VVLMFADGGQWLAVVLAVIWMGLVLQAEGARRGRVAGRPTSAGLLAALGLAFSLFGAQAGLGDRITDRGGAATPLDTAVFGFALAHRTPTLTSAAEVLNVAGSLAGLSVVALVASVLMLRRGRRLDAAVMVTAPAGSALLTWGFKLGYARPRPPEYGHLVPVSDFSLPSGHTVDATVILGVLTLLVLRHLRRRAARAAVLVLVSAGVLAAGAARVYLGVHWATDVLTGWLLGGVWVALCAGVLVAVGPGSVGVLRAMDDPVAATPRLRGSGVSRMAVAGLAVCGVVATSACGKAAPPVSAAAPTAPATLVTLAAPDHVLIVVLENKDEGDVLRDGPYLASLAASGAVLTDMHAEAHPSQPDYIALFSGDTQGVDNDSCPHTFDGPNLAAELVAAGRTFTGYSEDLPSAGYTGCAASGYARKHAPWTNFSSVPDGANQPLSAMPSDYAQLPTVAFVIPNLCHDMHDCSIITGDSWMRQNLDGYAQWARTHNSLLVVTFDESESKSDRDNHIATVAVGQRVVPGPVAGRTDHYGLLRTLEDLYRLPLLGHSADAAAIPGLWRAST
jgi:acid phosphatase